MAAWIADVEAKARIIHLELQAAMELAKRMGHDPDAITAPYIAMLAKLYRDDFTLASIADQSDLVAQFKGPDLSNQQLPVSLVTCALSKLRSSMQHIARSIAGLEEQAVRWPDHLEPRLSGLAQGGLVVGVRIPQPGEGGSEEQGKREGLSDGLYLAVREAVRSLPAIPGLIAADGISEEVYGLFPDPAIRDTLLVAAHRLAPSSGDLGISELVLTCPDDSEREPIPLTRSSHDLLSLCLRGPSNTQLAGRDCLGGVVSEIHLDALRFEIRGLGQQPGIRCIYGERERGIVQESLGCSVRVSGSYEAAASGEPRLVAVEAIEILNPADEQVGSPGH